MEIHDNFIQEQRLFQFLIAIDSKYETTKREIVKMESLPSVDHAYNLVKREEMRNQVLHPETGVTAAGIGAGLDVRGKPKQPSSSGGSSRSAAITAVVAGTDGTTKKISQNWFVHIVRERDTPRNLASNWSDIQIGGKKNTANRHLLHHRRLTRPETETAVLLQRSEDNQTKGEIIPPPPRATKRSYRLEAAIEGHDMELLSRRI